MPNAGDLIRAADVNDIADVGWTAYTPTLTSSGTAPTTSTAEGRYVRVGRIIIAECNIVIATAGTGTYSIALPVESLAAATDTNLNLAWLYDSSATLSQMGVAVAQAGGLTCQIRAHGVTGAMGNSAPWTWAVGDAIRLNLLYEAAA